MILIKHKLKKIEEIIPWGNEKDGYYLHWFGLTDSYYWISISQIELFRYSDEFLAKQHLKNEPPYVDYQFARIMDDFLSIFNKVVVPIPDRVFNYIDSLDKFKEFQLALKLWLNEKWNEEDDQYDEIYIPASEWIYDRRLDSGYLIGGPDIYFFYNSGKIFIRWDCSYETEDGVKMWNEPRGEFVLDYNEFVIEILNSFDEFWSVMDARIDEVISRWKKPNIHIDKELLIKNHDDQKRAYKSSINYSLSSLNKSEYDWDEIEKSIKSILNY